METTVKLIMTAIIGAETTCAIIKKSKFFTQSLSRKNFGKKN
jgi:hypothetical protein